MIVPAFWAEGRLQERSAGGQITVRRFGWSDESQEAAQDHADARTREAFDRIAAGEKLDRIERRVAYNGADSMPIREEIVDRQDAAVVTRNSYGARCLNTPDVLFVDIDFEPSFPYGRSRHGAKGFVSAVGLPLSVIAGVVVGMFMGTWAVGVAVALAMALSMWLVSLLIPARSEAETAAPAPVPKEEQAARARIEEFMNEHADWHLRLYRTPAGLRALAMHRTFSAQEPAVAECFERLDVDPVYARMCLNQKCFRARVSAKPWRIGIGDPLRPRPGVWPVAPDRLPAREKWVMRYEQKAQGYAACQFIEALGSGRVDPAVQAVQQWHDEMSRAESGLPLA